MVIAQLTDEASRRARLDVQVVLESARSRAIRRRQAAREPATTEDSWLARNTAAAATSSARPSGLPSSDFRFQSACTSESSLY